MAGTHRGCPADASDVPQRLFARQCGLLKTEWFYAGNWQPTSVEQFTQTLDSYIRWYNEKRIKMSLGARSPLDYRRSLGLVA